MTRQPTRLEAGRGVVLVYCQECPQWRELAGDRAEGYRVAAAHLGRVHDLPEAAARGWYRARLRDTPTDTES